MDNKELNNKTEKERDEWKDIQMNRQNLKLTGERKHWKNKKHK